jgi:hypothetical protein
MFAGCKVLSGPDTATIAHTRLNGEFELWATNRGKSLNTLVP